ncbi:MAG TPA: DUF423 domain-containing protein [Reyranella sp.]|jgi:uncharacterized membrane protein YgdD (TMEM256/DUF423 family)|nr:DUF423 domain-containing protein [Reyranella sp.]
MRNAQDRGWIVVAALSGAVSVMAGAFGAHGIDASTAVGARARELLQTGSHYEIAHALAILAVAALTRRAGLKEGLATAAQILFLAGSVLFPGALYALALGGPRWLGAVAPIGGLAFILGWLALALAALGRR